MKVFIRIVISIVLVLSMVFLAMGCGSGNKSSDQASSSTKSNETSVSTTSGSDAATNQTIPVPYVWKPDQADLEWRNGTSPVSFSAFMNINYTKPWRWDTDVTREITKRTGVTIEATYSPDSDGTKLNLMLASGDKLPDFLVLIDRNSKIYQDMVKDGVIWSLTELMDKYAPKMHELLPKGFETFIAEPNNNQLS